MVELSAHEYFTVKNNAKVNSPAKSPQFFIGLVTKFIQLSNYNKQTDTTSLDWTAPAFINFGKKGHITAHAVYERVLLPHKKTKISLFTR